jgi:type II secretory pathway component PulF
MALYYFQAIDNSGKYVAGEQEAASVQQALVELEGRGLTVQSIGLSPAPAAHANDTASSGQPSGPQPSLGKKAEQEVLRSHIATILDRGITILPALEAYAEELPAGRPRRQMKSLCRVITIGDTGQATAALVQSPEYWIPLLSAATSSADAGQILDEFLSESRRTDEIRQQWWLTLAYPIALVCLAGLVMVGLSVFVIPEFGRIFDEFDLELPELTLWVLNGASWLSNWRGLLVAVLVLAAIGAMLLLIRRFPASRIGWWSDRLRLPLSRRSALARFSRFLADLLEAGVSVPDSLRIAGFTVNHSRLQRSAWNLANQLDTAGNRPERIKPKALTAAVIYALSADLPATSRVRLLRDISACHAERVRIGLSWTSGIVEPLGICFVGLVVGMVVLALFLPLVRLIEGLSG